MKLLIAASGTGGHLFPAMGMAEFLKKQLPSLELLFAGHDLSTNRFFQKAEESVDIDAAPLSKMPHKLLRSFYKNTKGVVQAYALLKKYKPNAVIGFGSYHTAPILLAATLTKTPFFLFSADAIPGRVIRLFAPYAQATGVFYPESKAYLRGNSLSQMLPLRQSLLRLASSNYDLDPHRRVLLIVGGSQGASGLNEAVLNSVSKLPADIQFLHMAGSMNAKIAVEKGYKDLNRKASVHAFEPNMEKAYSVADAIIARSGASTIAEVLYFKLPALFVPYPHAQDDHQRVNANILEELGCARTVLERDCPGKLSEQVELLLNKDSAVKMKLEQAKRFESVSKNELLAEVLRQLQL